ncbi:3-carboxy-cis,cis-muconate cycloisomerase [Loktanella sp. S4079]|uniref:3-carboxy-cis,cis-muconate cycloisomerase n=1 Tax=Loktanella sp. S4079 TaxID=579483 RepID=UPI0005FA5CA7|nr:3-carboxy-cis,cis-muconate cycloisomerase [Loktanella sp. S4079]KJZ19042.1 3-carboxy-cis,cis-muconate cycloisomerase [Loktanella sp. S4079]
MTDVFEHPWLSGLLGDETAQEIFSAERQLAHMMAFEVAYTRALGAAGIVPAETAETVAEQLRGFQPDIADLKIGTGRDGLPVPALVKQLKALAGDNAKAVHSGATSQDVIDTATVLCLQSFSGLLDEQLATLAGGLAQLIEQFGDQPMMGRTRMQAAVPITVADRVQTWMLPIAEHRTRLAQIRPRVECLQLGGAAGNRAALGENATAVAAFMADELGLGNPPRAWHAMRDGIAEYAGLLSLITGTVGKMGQDVCLMAQQGIGEIGIDGGGGSSAMPHKQNPVLAELLVTLARFNATQLSGMHDALIHEQERSGASWTLEWMILPQMAKATARSLSAANALSGQVIRMGTPD